MNIMNTIFMTIPIVFDYPTLGLITKDEKQEFISKFIETATLKKNKEGNN